MAKTKAANHQSYTQGQQDKSLLAMTIGAAFDVTVAQFPACEALVVRYQGLHYSWAVWPRGRAPSRARSHIAYFKVPRHFRFVEDFPVTVTGKIQKFHVREISIEELTPRPVNPPLNSTTSTSIIRLVCEDFP